MDRFTPPHASARRRYKQVLSTVLLLLGTLPVAGYAGSAKRPPPPAAYIAECASCHVPFPARMLPAASWSAIVGTLDRHYGVDASVDSVTAHELTRWLTENASQRATARPPEDRLTRGTDFLRKHRDVPASVWSGTSVKSPANCSACHSDGTDGAFRERNVRIPRQTPASSPRKGATK